MTKKSASGVYDFLLRSSSSNLAGYASLTMAHNQDRLQNSDSSVVYGHGHIIYRESSSSSRVFIYNVFSLIVTVISKTDPTETVAFCLR
jgi:hypothetical protein